LNIKLLVLDVDGTIAGSSNQVSQPVKKAIQAAQAKGIKVAIATGRMYHSALRFHRDIGSELPLIAYNGAWIQNPLTQEHHYHQPVPSSLAVELFDYLQQPSWKPHLSLHFYLDDQLYVGQINADTQEYARRSGVKITVVEDIRAMISQQAPTKILAMGENTQVIQKLLGNLTQKYPDNQLYLTQSTTTFFEATHPQATKGSALCYLTEKLLGLQASQVMAIGDNFNDLTMLTYSGLPIAMGDAPQEVQASARWVAPGVEADGVAAAIEKFLL
jgi:Cof subfamily protein (haloacid dehalogenase superfamily)